MVSWENNDEQTLAWKRWKDYFRNGRDMGTGTVFELLSISFFIFFIGHTQTFYDSDFQARYENEDECENCSV